MIDACFLRVPDAQRVPELEAPQNGQDGAQEPTRGSGGVAREEPERRSWWARWFGD